MSSKQTFEKGLKREKQAGKGESGAKYSRKKEEQMKKTLECSRNRGNKRLVWLEKPVNGSKCREIRTK